MTYDVVALLERMPTDEEMLTALGAAGPEHRVRAVSGGMVIQVCDDDGDPLVSIDTPMYIQVPGEPVRLLGTALTDVPGADLVGRDPGRRRATADRSWPGSTREELVDRVGGQIWAPPPRVPAGETGVGDG